ERPCLSFETPEPRPETPGPKPAGQSRGCAADSAMRRRGSTSFDRTEACATAPDGAADRVRRGFAASDPAVTRYRLTDVSRASLMLEQVNLDRIDDKKGSVPGRLYGFVF